MVDTSGGCAGCGATLPESLGRKPRKWCSDKCRVATYYRQRPSKAREQRERRRLDHCKVYVEPCDECGTLRTWRYQRQSARLCGRACENVAKARRFNEKYWVDPESVRARRAEAYRLNPAAHKAASERRASRVGATDVEEVVPMAVFMRDGWTCGLCYGPIDRWRAWPDRLAASIDHVVPISLDGEHSLANCRAAHLVCNAIRGNRLGAKHPAYCDVIVMVTAPTDTEDRHARTSAEAPEHAVAS